MLVISDSALLPLSANGGGRKATPTFGRENLFFNFTNYLLELGAATRC